MPFKLHKSIEISSYLQVYTDEGHSLSGVFSHLYKTIENFFEESFGPPETNEWDPAGLFAFKQ